jgi:GTPase SAR1 family protein
MTVGDFILGTGASLLANAVTAMVRVCVNSGVPVPLRVHRQELRGKLREMPFIYKDIDAEVLTDFVDVDIQKVNVHDLGYEKPSRLDLTIERRLQGRRKVLLLGNAGVGKTTFIRHTILTMMDAKRVSFLYPDERVVPFYVPLKAVDNSQPAPIGRYLLETNTLFSGARGKSRLLQLAKRRRVILFLDGYDEIYLDLGPRAQHNFIREDLNWLFGKIAPRRVRDSYYTDLYRELKEARVWLSSRREFYATNPLDLRVVHNPGETPLDCIGLGLLGISNNRIELVRKIFDKYRSRATKFQDLLSEELFLQQVDRSGNEELRNLSDNPLFLTVMCFVYVDKALEAESGAVELSHTASDLVLRCVSLLLRDIDEFKARGLPAAQRLAISRRRNAFEQEKREFLQAFAWAVIDERRNVFTIDYVNEKARQFFGGGTASDSSRTIAALAEADSTSPDSFGQQLANQGIFVLAERVGPRVSYDFAHRRFKELLAARYIEREWSRDQIVALVEREELSEFVLVLIRESARRRDILERTLDLARAGTRKESFARLASAAVQMDVPELQPESLLEAFATKVLRGEEAPRLTRPVLSRIPLTAMLGELAWAAFEESIRRERRWQFGLAAELLARVRADELVRRLDRLLQEGPPPTILLDVLHFLYRLQPRVIGRHLPYLSSNDDTLLAFAHTAAASTSTLDDTLNVAEEMMRQLDARELAVMVLTFRSANPAALSSLIKRRKNSELARITLLVDGLARDRNRAAQLLEDGAGAILGLSSRDEIDEEAFGEFQRYFQGRIFRAPTVAKELDAEDIERFGLIEVNATEVKAIIDGLRIEEDSRLDGRTPRRAEFEFFVS